MRSALCNSRCCHWSRKIAPAAACCGFSPADFDHSPYFEIIKAPFQLTEIPRGMDAVPWKGNQGALAPERQRHLSLVEPTTGNQG